MDCNFGLHPSRNREKTAQCRGFALHNPIDFEPDSFLIKTNLSITEKSGDANDHKKQQQTEYIQLKVITFLTLNNIVIQPWTSDFICWTSNLTTLSGKRRE